MTTLLLSLAILAAIETGASPERVEAIECNTFGPLTPPWEARDERTALIFRDPDGSIVDWRWYQRGVFELRRLPDESWLLMWNDHGYPRAVICREFYRTRTLQDVELKERAALSAENRRKLRWP